MAEKTPEQNLNPPQDQEPKVMESALVAFDNVQKGTADVDLRKKDPN